MTDIHMDKAYADRHCGDIRGMGNAEFTELFNLILYEKARRTMAKLNTTTKCSIGATFSSDGERVDGVMTPTVVRFHHDRVTEWFDCR